MSATDDDESLLEEVELPLEGALDMRCLRRPGGGPAAAARGACLLLVLEGGGITGRPRDQALLFDMLMIMIDEYL